MADQKKGKKILLYYYSNKRSVPIETLCVEINKTGNKLIVLTQFPRGDLHKEFERLGIECYVKTYKSRISLINYFLHFIYLIKFCSMHRIDVIWSQLNQCNLVAVFAQYFIKARVVIFRHHFHASIKTEGFSSINKNEMKTDKIISRLAKEIVVPSLEVYNGMVTYEKVNPGKISIIPYIYNFEQYNKPDPAEVEKIRKQYDTNLLIVTASRMIKLKRHDLVLPVFKKLIEEGFSIKVLLLDEGEEKERLQQYVKNNKLENNIFFLGFRSNIIDYLAAADLLVHPSYTEASSSLVKEFGLMKKPVIVCSGVGDFDEYLIHGRNGFLVNWPNEAEEFEKYIKKIYCEPDYGDKLGENLHRTILDTFSPGGKVIEMYYSKI